MLTLESDYHSNPPTGQRNGQADSQSLRLMDRGAVTGCRPVAAPFFVYRLSGKIHGKQNTFI